MKIVVSTDCTFIPEWKGNRGLDASEQIVVTYKEPDMPMYEKLVDKPRLTMKTNDKQEFVGGESVIEIDNKKIVKEMVIKIENLSYERNGKEVPIANGPSLFSAGVPSSFHELTDEIGMEMQRVLAKAVDAKN
jgi:hypothetical protein